MKSVNIIKEMQSFNVDLMCLLNTHTTITAECLTLKTHFVPMETQFGPHAYRKSP